MVCYILYFGCRIWCSGMLYAIRNMPNYKIKRSYEPQRDSVGLYLIGNNTEILKEKYKPNHTKVFITFVSHKYVKYIGKRV